MSVAFIENDKFIAEFHVCKSGPASATTVGHDPLAGCAGSEASAGIVRSRSGSEAGDGSAYKRRWEL